MKVGDKVRIGSDFIDAGEVGEIVEINGPWIYVEEFGVYHRDDLELVEEPSQWDFLEDTMEYEVPKTVLTPRGKKTEWVKPTKREYEMTTEEYFEFIDKVCEEMKELVKAKNADYTSGVSPFANFKASTRFGVDPITGLAVRMGDKMQRLQSYCTRGKLEVEGEGLAEIAYDFIGYSWLLLGMIEEKKRNK